MGDQLIKLHRPHARNTRRSGRLTAIALVAVLLAIILLTRATVRGADDPNITNPDIIETSDYLYFNPYFFSLYYSNLMPTTGERFWLVGDAEGSYLDRIECSAAFDRPTPFIDDYPAEWECGPYEVSGSDDDDGSITVSLYDTLGPDLNLPDDVRTFPYTLDIDDPTSAAVPFPYDNDGPIIAVPWSADDAAAGVLRTCLYYKKDAGAWTDANQCSTGKSGTFGFAPAGGDGTYYFQTVAEDNVSNAQSVPSTGDGDGYTTLDTVPPTVLVSTPDSLLAKFWQVSWTGDDPAPGSGIDHYDVQYRVDEDGTWEDWPLEPPTSTSAIFGPTSPVVVQAGHSYGFRARAYDLATNQGDYSAIVSTIVEFHYTFLPVAMRDYRDSPYEENDECQDAYGPLVSGQPYRAYPDDTNDYYYFELVAPATVNVSVTDYAPTSSYGAVALYYDDCSDEDRIDYFGIPGLTSMSLGPHYLDRPGRYFIQVYTAAQHSNTQLYTLTVTY